MATKSLRPAAGDWQIARQPDRDPFFQLHREIGRLFDDMLRGFGPMRGLPAERSATLTPSVDICETNDALQIRADLPGVAEKDVDVTLDRDMLTIRGERKAESEEKQPDYHMMERSHGSFMRSFRLPFAADAGKVAATLKNGVLTVTVPKPSEAQQRERRIAVKGEAAGSAQAPSTQAAPQPQTAPAGTER